MRANAAVRGRGMATKKKVAAKRGARKTAPKIGDTAVEAATGKTWAQWFTLLDRAGGRKKTHKEIVAVMAGTYGVVPWWRQMVTVAYEQTRGLRGKHEKPDGFEISRTKTLGSPVGDVFEAFGTARRRVLWLPGERPLVRKATENRSLRITWTDGTNVEVALHAKGPSKTQVTVQHGRLGTPRAAARLKAYWGSALDRLATYLAD